MTIPIDLLLRDNAKIQIYDNSGRLVLSEKIENQSRQININTTSFSNGLYFVGLWNNGQLKASDKLIISQ